MSSNKKRMSAAKDTKGTVKRLLGYLSAYKLRFIFVVICIAVSEMCIRDRCSGGNIMSREAVIEAVKKILG